jgi:mono/diheme cytochrome c family protein
MFLYVPVVVLAIVVLGMVFSWQFKSGEDVGASLPPPTKEVDAAKVVNLRALAKDTGLSADGKMLYTINCASCHGNTGEGDGPRSVGLNPPPRNYKTEQFKFGSDIVSIFHTLEKGSPGTSMPSFSLLPPRDLMAMAHYVRTLVPNPTATTDEIIAQLPEAPAGADAGGETAADETSAKRIPITLAMQQLEKASYSGGKTEHAYDQHSLGAQVYLQRCAKCHGEHGEGMATAVVGVAPYRYLSTPMLSSQSATWLADRAKFDSFVIYGVSGRTHPGNGAMTREQLDALYGFVQQLATR